MQITINCVIFLCIFIIRIKSQSDICSESGDQIQISNAFRLNSNLFVITPKETVYRIKNFLFDNNQLTFQSIERDNLLTKSLKGVKWIFTLKVGTDIKVITIFSEEVIKNISLKLRIVFHLIC